MADEEDAQLEETEQKPGDDPGPEAKETEETQPQAAPALLGPAGIVDPAGTGAVAGAVVLPTNLPKPPPGTGRRKAPEGSADHRAGDGSNQSSSQNVSGAAEIEYVGWQPRGSSSENGTKSSAASEAHSADTTDGSGHYSVRRPHEPSKPEPAAALTSDRLLSGRDTPPVGGWRRWVYEASFGYVNLGDSDKVRQDRVIAHRVASRLGERTRYVPVLSRKGGVGKTTVTMLLGLVLAEMREDRVIAMDANPDRGTLSDRSPGRADYTARELLKNRFDVDTLAKLAAYVSRDGSRLDVLASDTDPAVAEAFDDADYRAVTDILNHYYSIVLTDSGTGMVHSVMKGTLEKADALVLVSGGSVDEARLASETLSWLEAHGRQDLVSRAVVVINLAAGDGIQVDVDEIESHFTSRVKAVLRLPYDRHLAEGSQIQLNRLRPQTRVAAVELAALVVDELQGL
ncbi:MinD/ParA family protein [Acaricomes phytoseiuli]|uniref:MinD/ParA family ATP-binding protein n=1 Tax=Acaricomes phytoseiuli TaxID=291968 RepID=UPI002222218A|nr:MinD/ParA family protein [Acaricomes phytoseiuli]MCW1249528.1 MinD/ParA family protein [Acaricomes phytoseiuli]